MEGDLEMMLRGIGGIPARKNEGKRRKQAYTLNKKKSSLIHFHPGLPRQLFQRSVCFAIYTFAARLLAAFLPVSHTTITEQVLSGVD